MSAIRNSANRADARKKKALPYTRSTVVTFFRRVFGIVDEEDEPELPELPTSTPPNDRTVTDEASGSSSHSQDNPFHAAPPQKSYPNRRPLSDMDFINFSPMGASDPPSSFLSSPDPRDVPNRMSSNMGANSGRHSAGSSVSEMQSTSENPEQFHFTFTTSRLESASFGNFNRTPASSTSSPAKKLKRNPNGVYRWDGPGSAKRSRQRNRFATPAFTTPSKTDPTKDGNISGETDYKRRKTGESAALTSEPSISSLPFPTTTSPSTPKVNGSAPRPSTTSSAARLRTPAKPTAPVVPSPLRHAWSDSPPSSREDLGKSAAQHVKPTQTATFMADLIKETTPAKKPDLSNPYQTASPVGKVGPPRRGTRRPRPAARPAVPSKEDQLAEEKKQKEKEKLDSYSPQAIIEATLPKGSKRSRPPANFEKSSPKPENSQYQVEEPEDDECNRAAKKPKPSLNGNGRPSGLFNMPLPATNSDITVEEIGDVPLHEDAKDENRVKAKDTTKSMNGNLSTVVAASANASTSRASFSALKSIPKEPSKLRFSFQAEGSPASSVPPVSPSPLPPRSSPSAVARIEQAKPVVPSSGFNFVFSTNGDVNKAADNTSATERRPPTIEEIKADVKSMDLDTLPVFNFSISAVSVSLRSAELTRASADVKVLPPSSLPTFSFTDPVVKSSSNFKFDTTPVPSASTFSNTSKPHPRIEAPPVKAFNWAASGLKMKEEKDVWTCFCGVKNANSAVQCVACESPSPVTSSAASKTADAPKPTLPSAPVVKGFDFAAAGFKLPAANKDSWTCSECTLSNSNSAATCGPCGADRK